MLQQSQIKGLGLVGWRSSMISGMPVLTSANTATSSGMTYSDFSSLVTVQNLYRCQEDSAITDTNFNTFLTNLTDAAFVKVLNAVFQDDDFIENKVLFPYENIWTELLTNDVSFVGYEITPANRKELTISINNVFTSFDSADSLKLLLFHSSKKLPIQTKTITVEELTETNTALNWDLANFNYSGGKFYVGYLRSGLTAKAVNRDWDAANVRNCFNMFKIEPVKVQGWNSETLFDVDDVEYESETWGLNFDLTSWKDYTNIVVRNKNKFTNALGLQVAADTLDLILKATRSNRIERELEARAFAELEGFINADLPRTYGIAKKLSDEIARLRKSFIETPQIQRATL
jgi:hypothetical protein